MASGRSSLRGIAGAMSEHKLPLKYSDPEGKGYCDALMPSECRRGSDAKGLF